MTTPTKEQIEKVLKETSKRTEKPNFPFVILNLMDLGYDEEEITEMLITEWEKIKDVDARVEKMCKNNPGIKDFEDFNKAINSPK